MNPRKKKGEKTVEMVEMEPGINEPVIEGLPNREFFYGARQRSQGRQAARSQRRARRSMRRATRSARRTSRRVKRAAGAGRSA